MAIPFPFGSVSPDRRLSREAVVTLTMQSLFTFGMSMSNTFLNLYLWRLTESLWINGVYNVLVNLFTAVGFILGGKLTKTKDRMVTYRIGITLIAVFFLLVVTAREHVVSYYALFAAFYGLAGGYYWIGYWTLYYDVSNNRNRMRFLGLGSAFATIATLIGPFLTAVVFEVYGGLKSYIIIFTLSFFVFLLTALFSLRIPKIENPRKTYYLRLMGVLFNKNKTWRKSLFGNLLTGIMQGVFLFLPQFLIFSVLKNEAAVSYFNAALAILSVAVNFGFSRWARERGERQYLLWSVIGYTIAGGLLLFKLSLFSAIGFMFLHTLCNPLKSNSFDSYFYRLMGTLPLRGRLRVESLVVREICWDAGRIVVVLFLISLADNLSAPWLPWVVIFACLSQFGLYFLMENKSEISMQTPDPKEPEPLRGRTRLL